MNHPHERRLLPRALLVGLAWFVLLAVAVLFGACSSSPNGGDATITPQSATRTRTLDTHIPDQVEWKIEIKRPSRPPPPPPDHSSFADAPVATLALFAPKQEEKKPSAKDRHPPAPTTPPPEALDAIRELARDNPDADIIVTHTTKPGATETHTSNTNSSGAGLRTNNAAAIKEFDPSAPTVDDDGFTSRGGGRGASFHFVGLPKGTHPLTLIGAIVLALGLGGYLAFLYFKVPYKQLMLILAAIGAVLIGVGVSITHFPWVWLAIPFAIIGLGGYAVYKIIREEKANTRLITTLDAAIGEAHREKSIIATTLNSVVKGVENAGAAASAPVRAEIKKIMTSNGTADAQRAVVRQAKAGVLPTE